MIAHLPFLCLPDNFASCDLVIDAAHKVLAVGQTIVSGINTTNRHSRSISPFIILDLDDRCDQIGGELGFEFAQDHRHFLGTVPHKFSQL